MGPYGMLVRNTQNLGIELLGKPPGRSNESLSVPTHQRPGSAPAAPRQRSGGSRPIDFAPELQLDHLPGERSSAGDGISNQLALLGLAQVVLLGAHWPASSRRELTWTQELQKPPLWKLLSSWVYQSDIECFRRKWVQYP